MTPKPKDFYGKEVADAIRKACEKLQVPQEQLEIEVVETGSTGIFGLIRKKAHIKASVKEPEGEKVEKLSKTQPKPKAEKVEKKTAAAKPAEQAEQESPPQDEQQGAAHAASSASKSEKSVDSYDDEDDFEDNGQLDAEAEGEESSEEQLSEDTIACVRQELTNILELMGYPSPVEVTAKGTSIFCHVGEEYEDVLTGQDGKTLDSLQYLLRKIIVRKVPSRVRLTVDVGNYREKRIADLKERAAELAESVRNDGKTQVIPSLSPSERRVVHMSLQENKDIRSRSVGEGLFKKILIYKPGKSGRGGGRKRGNSKGRRNNNSRKKNE